MLNHVVVSNIEGVASDNSQYLRSWEWRELRLWSPRPWEEGSVDRMLVNHHKCYFGDVPYTMWLSFYYKKSAQLRTENYCTKIPYVHSHASVTTSFIPGNLSPALQPSVLYYVSRGRWRGYWVSYVFFCRYVVYVELIRIRPLALILIRAPN